MTRRFDNVIPPQPVIIENPQPVIIENPQPEIIENDNSPKDHNPNINVLLEIASAPDIDSALVNLDKITSKPGNLSSAEMKTFLEQGLVKSLFHIIQNTPIDQEIIKTTVRILGNIASGPTSVCKCIVDEGGIPIFMAIFHKSEEIDDHQLMEMVFFFFF